MAEYTKISSNPFRRRRRREKALMTGGSPRQAGLAANFGKTAKEPDKNIGSNHICKRKFYNHNHILNTYE